jgi:hypothetical protein
MSKYFITPISFIPNNQNNNANQNNNIRQPDKIDHNGTQYWYLPGTTIPHNEDGPAVLFPGGTAYYYLNGKRDRKGGLPTITGPGGFEEYHVA